MNPSGPYFAVALRFITPAKVPSEPGNQKNWRKPKLLAAALAGALGILNALALPAAAQADAANPPPSLSVESIPLFNGPAPDVLARSLSSAYIPSLTLDVSATAPKETDESELAKKTLNPVADLISVPFQYNIDFGIGPKNVSRSTLNIQPVIPVSLNKDWNLIIRTILPVIYADSPADGVSTNWGLGDTTQSFFLSPVKPIGGWILGVGPAFLWPTATDTALGTGKWSAGPTAVALRQEHGWTYGILANQLWSFAGDSDRSSVNATYLQPFLTYTFPTYTSLGINTESTYDWTTHQWTVPINLFANQLIKIGKMPVNLQVGGRYYAEGPSGGPEWGLRFAFTFLFPK